MQINGITSQNILPVPPSPRGAKPVREGGQKPEAPKISAENYRANFMPAFKGFQRAGEAILVKRSGGEQVKVRIEKENILDEYINFKLYTQNDYPLGLMDMVIHSPFPKKYDGMPVGYSPVRLETYPEITHLRSIGGFTYAGIGSTLVNIAIEESKKYGFDGALWLNAERGYLDTISKYRQDTSPIPFYYKMGFKATGRYDDFFEGLFKRNLASCLPDNALLVLTPENANAETKYHKTNFTFY